MKNLLEYSKELLASATELVKMFSEIGSDKLSSSKRKRVIQLFVKINEVKKEIVKLVFKRGANKMGARDRILIFLKENVGQVVTGKQLAEVGGISEFARRVRELRHEHGGWQISTGMNRPDLRPDEYVLENLEQKPAYERMNTKVWAKVLERDDFTCQNCGWKKGDPQTNSRKFLEVHHKNPVRAKGKPTMENLITLCNICHDAKEAMSSS